jgi:serine/threonine protein phosphatase 1
MSMRTFAIGDVHGCLTALDALLPALDLRDGDKLIFLGDLIDRGPDSRGVMERVVRLHAQRPVDVIQGNHEEMLLAARKDSAFYKAWLNFGGRETLVSYGWETGQEAAWQESIPREHWDFLSDKLVDCVETDGHILVHAAVDPNLPLSEQPWPDLRWERFIDPPPHKSGKVVICGHTHQPGGEPVSVGHAVCIDTWVYGPGWLTALELETGRYWQANQRGESRTGQLGE